ncbi:MAG TPA: alpha/beta fold hydrolase [Terrimicrobiaceae bacterium]
MTTLFEVRRLPLAGITLPRARLRGLVAVFLLSLTGCGSTIVTRIHSRDVLARYHISQSERQALRMERRAGLAPPRLRSPEAEAQALAQWAGQDSNRLTIAAEATLQLRVRDSERIVGFALTALRLAWSSLQASQIPASRWLETSATRRTMAAYNAALERFVSRHTKELAKGISNQEFWTPLGPIELSTAFLARMPYRAGYFDNFIPADHVSVRGMGRRVRIEGLGVALVASRVRTSERDSETYYHLAGKGVFAPFAAVATFEVARQLRARIELIDLNSQSTMATKEGTIPLSGDFTAPFALSFRGINDLLMGISGLINISKRENDAGLYLTEPFDPDRIPVVMIHGLTSSPLVWRTITTSLSADPLIRKSYQFWYVYYPTGMPIPESAASIRDDIATIRKKYDPRGTSIASRHIVLVGYSMGGVIAHILSTSIGTRYWDAIAKVPFDKAPLDSQDRAELRRLLFWKPIPGLDRTIFIATPHHGTRLADSRIATLGRRLVGLPSDFISFQVRMFDALGNILQGDFLTGGLMTGINSLSPSAPLYKALDGAPFAPGLKFDSIIGDRGRPEGENSTDGIVGYWSSHIEGAESEVIVPTGHDAHLHPKTIADLRRILLLNLRKP